LGPRAESSRPHHRVRRARRAPARAAGEVDVGDARGPRVRAPQVRSSAEGEAAAYRGGGRRGSDGASGRRRRDRSRAGPVIGMTRTILTTGLGPFPGAPFNPPEPLVAELGRHRFPANAKRIVHVFRVSYETIDRELPALLKAERPDALVMFGLAARSDHLRVETRARNGLNR